MRGFTKITCGVAGLLLWSAGVTAGAFDAKWTPFEWSIYSPVQIFSGKTEVAGLRLNTVYGDNATVYGVDTGIVGSAEKAHGLQISLANSASMNMNGVQIGLGNQVGREDRLKTGKAVGAQIGWVNASNADFCGAQIGSVNLNDSAMAGTQIGFINSNDDSKSGGQGNCFQLGVLNFNKNGFLPFFVLFNF